MTKDAKIIRYDYNNYEYEILKISHDKKPFRKDMNYSFKDYFKFEFNQKHLFVNVLSVLFVLIMILSVATNAIIFYTAFGTAKLGITGTMMTFSSHAFDPDARSLAVNITRGCSDDMRCNFEKIVDYVNEFDYVVDGNRNSRLYSVNQTVKDTSGECQGLSYLFNSLYSEVGGNVVIKCNRCHCYSVVVFDDPYEKFVYDPTANMVFFYDEWILEAFDRMCLE